MRSSGALNTVATSVATGTPPRGNARMTGRWSLYSASAAASRRPASDRSLNGTASSYVTGPTIFAGRDESAGYDPAILIPSLGEYDAFPLSVLGPMFEISHRARKIFDTDQRRSPRLSEMFLTASKPTDTNVGTLQSNQV